MPKTYRKLIAVRHSRSFREAATIVECDAREPAEDEIVVRNLFAGVNASDVNATAGVAGGREVPFDLGVEVAGEVVAVGRHVERLRVGQHVITDFSHIGAGYREFHVRKASSAWPVEKATPEMLTIGVSGVTALVGLKHVGVVRSGETVLVTAAAGAVGQYVVQLAKQAGAHVLGTCSSEEKARRLRELGCDRVVDLSREALERVLSDEYPRGIDLVFENVGGAIFDTCVDHLAIRGRVVICGYVSEYKAAPEAVVAPRVYTKLLWKSASLLGFLAPHYAAECAAATDALISAVQSGRLRAPVDPHEFHGLEGVFDAVDHLQSGKSCGKVMVRFDPRA